MIFLLSYMFSAVNAQVLMDSIYIVDTLPLIFKNSKPAYSISPLSAQMSAFLSDITSAQVQVSAPGGLTTLLHRGMGSRHLPILWEGVNIQSVTNGSFDLGLIPLHLYSGTQFYTFGSPTLTGTNAIAGAMNISDTRNNGKNYLGTQASTLHNIDWIAKYSLVGKSYTLMLGGDYSDHQNKYTYKINQIKENRIGTAQQKYNIIANANLYLSHNQYIGFNIWQQGSSRAIPSGITSSQVDQHQNDKNLRIKTSHVFSSRAYKVTTWAAFMHENIEYRTSSVDSKSTLKSLNFGSDISTSSNLAFKAVIRNDIIHANFYTEQKSRNQINLTASKIFDWAQTKLLVSVRQDLVDTKWMPLSMTSSITHEKFTFGLSRNYNLPGFNDLYWPASGNVNLKTEISNQGEANYWFEIKGLKLKQVWYINYVKDWIQWVPASNGLWYPSNQKSVLSKGFELKVNREWYVKTIKFGVDVHFHFNKTAALDHFFDKALIGKQLVYVPKHTVTSQFSMVFHKHTIQASFRFSGKRYYTPDNEYYINPYTTIDLAYQLRLSRRTEVNINIQNLTNNTYQIVRFFPLPGTSGSILFKYYFKL